MQYRSHTYIISRAEAKHKHLFIFLSDCEKSRKTGAEYGAREIGFLSENIRYCSSIYLVLISSGLTRGLRIFACAAASLAMGTRNGEQDT